MVQALHDTFVAFGNVLSCKVATDEAGNSRGYGFVHYETAEAAETAIKAVNGMLLNDKKVFVGHHISRKVYAIWFAWVMVLKHRDILGAPIQNRRDEGAVYQSLCQEYRSRGFPG